MPKRTMTTHDLRSCYWGHSIIFLRRNDDGSWRVCIFQGPAIEKDDIVLARSKSGGTLRYRVTGDVERPMDPGDQHFATLVYEPED